MRIDSSSVVMASSRSYQEETKASQTTVRRYRGEDGQVQKAVATAADLHTQRFQAEGGTTAFAASEDGLKTVAEKKDGLKSFRKEQGEVLSARQGAAAGTDDIAANAAGAAYVGSARASGGADWLSSVSDAIDNDPTVQMLRKCLEMLERALGRSVSSDTRIGGRKLGDIMHVNVSSVSARYQQAMALGGGETAAMQNLAVRADNPNGYWTRQTIISGFVQGEERTAFRSNGTVVTADGRTIDFGINVEMSRSFEQAVNTEGKEAVYTDPLVINLDTDAASLSDVSFCFDLDCDGTAEEISALDSGSGFLALDKNGDGEINDGSELFGAKTGDGFAELARYDQDGNGWIDEGDEVFSKLSVWVRCGDGSARQISLADAGVGAIFLGSQSTQYTLSNPSGEENAVVRRTGVYLKESGEVGSVQHLDFKM